MNTDITSPPAAEPKQPIADVKQPPVEPPANPQAPVTQPPADKKQEAPKPVPVQKASKPAGSGVTAAIVATVIIVLGLAALATYAYLQSR